MNLFLEIITPENIVYKDKVDEIIVPTVNGQITILPNHIGLLTQTAHGELVVKKGDVKQIIAITNGFLEVANNKVCILANYAIKAENINMAEAEEAKKRAEKLMLGKATDKDFRIAEAQLRKAILELKVGLKHKRRTI